MIEMGIVVGIGLLVSLSKMNWQWRMHVLSQPLLVDLIVFAVLVLLHWGTFSGVMVASVGALFCSLTLSAARKLCGHIENGYYVPGYLDVGDKLTK
jgi:hypothetical protein